MHGGITKNVTMKEYLWKTALGETKKFSEIDHQHLSNILWFREILTGANFCNCEVQRTLNSELRKRFDGKRLPWKPLPIPNEIGWIREAAYINQKGEIIGTMKTPSHYGKVIGSIAHIEKLN
jgi:hypothetical protein